MVEAVGEFKFALKDARRLVTRANPPGNVNFFTSNQADLRPLTNLVPPNDITK
jgi:hypothetical protein